jgi:hypothetical protein
MHSLPKCIMWTCNGEYVRAFRFRCLAGQDQFTPALGSFNFLPVFSRN